jgi:hypothetical protein
MHNISHSLNWIQEGVQNPFLLAIILWNTTTWHCSFLTNTDTQAPNYMAYISENHNPDHLLNMDRNVMLPHISQLHT